MIRIRHAVFASLLLGAAMSLAASAGPSGEGRVWRVMPVGDSITEGGKPLACYRPLLLKKLVAAGYRVEFAGSRQSESDAGPLRHEGYGGKNVEFIAKILGKNFREHPADIVLIHAGHNHFAEEKPVPGIVAATEKIVSDVRAVNPRVTVLLAQVIPSGKLPKYSCIPDLNRALAELAKKLDRPDRRVILVDQATGFDVEADTVADRVHPNEKGAEKMAARWFEALKPVLDRGR